MFHRCINTGEEDIVEIIESLTWTGQCTDKKEKKIFLIYKEIHMGAVATSYMRKDLLIYEEMRKYLVIYEEAVSHI